MTITYHLIWQRGHKILHIVLNTFVQVKRLSSAFRTASTFRAASAFIVSSSKSINFSVLSKWLSQGCIDSQPKLCRFEIVGSLIPLYRCKTSGEDWAEEPKRFLK